MARSHHIIKLLKGQRGGVAIWFAICLPVLLGCAALAVDLARINLTKVELQNAVDAAALGGSSSLSNTQPPPGPSDTPYNWSAATATALDLARSNYANAAPIHDALIETGFWNIQNPSLGLRPSAGVPVAGDVPAIKVTVAISSTQNNGPLQLFFAPILGIANSNVQASAISILTGAGGPFDYAIYSGSTSNNLSINGSTYNIKGSIHTNKNLNINGSSITVTGAAEAKGTVTTNGSNIDIGSTLPNDQRVISMPDFSASIAAAAAAVNQTYTGTKTINGSSITSDPIYVQGSPGTITVNGSSFTTTGTVMADGNISINGSGVASLSSQVCFYSKNGSIYINGSNYNLNGVLYAPNGTIFVNGSQITVNGSVVGKQISINGSEFTIDRTDYPITSITSLPGNHAQLVE